VNLFRDGDSCDFEASARVDVRVTVLEPDGRAPDRVEIACESSGRKVAVRRRTHGPVISLAPGDWRLTAVGGSLSAFEAAPVEITLTAGEPERAVTLELAPRRGISGRILGVDDGYVDLRWLRVPANGAVTDEELVRRGNRSPQTGAPEFRFGLFGVPDGRYRFGVVREGSVVVSVVVELSGEPVVRDITVPEEDDANFIMVSVVGPKEAPVEDAWVSTQFRAAGPGGTAWGNGRHVRRGIYRVRHPRLSAAQRGVAGTYAVHVRSETLGTRIEDYAGPTAGSHTVRMPVPGWIDLVLEGYERSGYLNRTEILVTRVVRGRIESANLPGWNRPDSTGRMSLGPLAPGRWDMRVKSDLEGARGHRVASRQVQVSAGRQTTRIALPRLCFLTLVAERETRYTVRFPPGRGGSYRSAMRTGKDGRATFGPLPAGAYVIHERGREGRRQMTMRIERDAEVEFEPD